MTGWWQYVVRISGTTIQKVMAGQSGLSESAFSRWKKEEHKPEADHVIAFARAYGRPPVEALVAAGYLDVCDANGVIEVWPGLGGLTDDELLNEVRRRMAAIPSADGAGNDPEKPPRRPILGRRQPGEEPGVRRDQKSG